MKSITDFILGLAAPQQAIVTYLHDRLTEHHGLTQHMKYEIPMYYEKSWVCYLNPIKKQGIELAFLRGYQLSNDQKILNSKGRKMVSGIDLHDLSNIPIRAIDEIVQEALILDEMSKKKR